MKRLCPFLLLLLVYCAPVADPSPHAPAATPFPATRLAANTRAVQATPSGAAVLVSPIAQSPTLTPRPPASPTAASTQTPFVIPTDWRATLFPFETLSPDLPYQPYIDPRLSPWVEHALARLESCQPEIYLNVREYVKRYTYTEDQTDQFVALDGDVHISLGTFRVPGLSPEATEILTMATIAHESRHIWQYVSWQRMWRNEAELDAYSYELPTYACPTSDPEGVRYLLEWTQAQISAASK